MSDFKLKYRPTTLSEVWGNEHVKKVWSGFQKRGNYPRATILHGDYGLGKTTLARILGADIIKEERNQWGLLCGFQELDSTEYSSESLYRLLSQVTSHVHGTLVYFFDEFHRMPDKAQDMLLKPIEESENLYFIFATHGVDKVDGGIRSRSTELTIQRPPKLVLVEKLKRRRHAKVS